MHRRKLAQRRRPQTVPLFRSDQARIKDTESHGTQTPDGKARSALNALKHGRYATCAIVLRNEDPEAFEDLVAGYVRRIRPVVPVVYHLMCELASIIWRLTRVDALDARLLNRRPRQRTPIQSLALTPASSSNPTTTRPLTSNCAIVGHSEFPACLPRGAAQLIHACPPILAIVENFRIFLISAGAAYEVVLSQRLNQELFVSNEPGTNPAMRPAPSPARNPVVPQLAKRRQDPLPPKQLGSVRTAGSVPGNSTSRPASARSAPVFKSGAETRRRSSWQGRHHPVVAL
jgi:hypothetical protein